jgi:hypothetical protein
MPTVNSTEGRGEKLRQTPPNDTQRLRTPGVDRCRVFLSAFTPIQTPNTGSYSLKLRAEEGDAWATPATSITAQRSWQAGHVCWLHA